MGSETMFVLIMMNLPKYMKEIVGFSVRDIGFYSSLTSLLSWTVSICSGFLSDFLIHKKYLTTVQTRKFFTILGKYFHQIIVERSSSFNSLIVSFSIEAGIFPPIFLVTATYTECDRVVFIAMELFAAGFGGNYWAGVLVNPLDLAPNYAGALLSYINGTATIVSFIFPVLIGIIISDVKINSNCIYSCNSPIKIYFSNDY